MLLILLINARENQRGNEEWTNPETQATSGTQDTGRRQAKQKHNIEKNKMSNTDPTKNRG